jgi:hypothetical protein
MDDGLDRHEAIHAIALVLLEFMRDLMNASESGTDPNAPGSLWTTGGDHGDGFGHSDCMEGIMFAILRGANSRRHDLFHLI